MAKNRKITDTDKAFYKLGCLHEKGRLAKTLALLKATNRQLWEELMRLDKMEPVVGVILTFAEAERLARALRRPKASCYRAQKLEKKIEEARNKAKLISLQQ